MKHTINDLADMVVVRNHLQLLANGPRGGPVSRDEEKAIREFIEKLDRNIINCALSDKCLCGGSGCCKKSAKKKTTKKTTTKVVRKSQDNADE